MVSPTKHGLLGVGDERLEDGVSPDERPGAVPLLERVRVGRQAEGLVDPRPSEDGEMKGTSLVTPGFRP